MKKTNNGEGVAVFAIINLGGEMDDRILIVHDKDKPVNPMHKCPGGRSENNETPEQTLYREVLKEEVVGLKIESVSPQPFFRKKLNGHEIIFFTIKANGSSDVKPGDEIDEIKICSPDEITDLIAKNRILPNHAEALTKYLQECCLPY